MKAEPASDRTRILIVKLSSLGDLFHALPAVRNLRDGLGASIDWVVQTEYADVVRCFTDVNRVIAFRRRYFLWKLGSFLKDLREAEYDYIIDLQGLFKSALVTRWARGKQRIGPSFHREGSRFFYTAVAGEKNKERHAVEENLDIVRHLGLTVVSPQFPVSFPGPPVDLPSPRVAFLPMSRWKSKNWPLASYAAVARSLLEHANASILLLGGKKDFPVCMELEKLVKGPVQNMAGRTTFTEMGSLLAEMDLVISNDTGPMHMAAALGVPLLAIFGPTDPKRTGPYGSRQRVITSGVPCRPCFDKTCKLGHTKCLEEITTETVADAALEMLGA